MSIISLGIPEEFAGEVAEVILAGLNSVTVTDDTYQNLSIWCDEVQDYLESSLEE